MKIDMSPTAITLRLKQVNQLRRTCLALAQSSLGMRIQEKHKTNESVQRTSKALAH